MTRSNGQAVTVVRVYLSESEHRLDAVLAYLHDEAAVRGWTVYRGVSGYGRSGKVRDVSLADLALDLPVTVEFFEEAGRVDAVLEGLLAIVPEGHVVCWPATMPSANPQDV